MRKGKGQCVSFLFERIFYVWYSFLYQCDFNYFRVYEFVSRHSSCFIVEYSIRLLAFECQEIFISVVYGDSRPCSSRCFVAHIQRNRLCFLYLSNFNWRIFLRATGRRKYLSKEKTYGKAPAYFMYFC